MLAKNIISSTLAMGSQYQVKVKSVPSKFTILVKGKAGIYDFSKFNKLKC